jgi:phytol kinase
MPVQLEYKNKEPYSAASAHPDHIVLTQTSSRPQLNEIHALELDLILPDWKPASDLPQQEITGILPHISAGALALSYPWYFLQEAQVWLLATVATLGLLALRFVRRLNVPGQGTVVANQRKSYAGLCFPLAIATLYSLAEGQFLLYLVPLLILTFADSLAALVGFFYGRHCYQSPDGSKTIEGSLTMFAVSMVCVYIPLDIVTLFTFDTIFLIAFNLAIVITLVEAISWRGLDNFTIPVAGFYLLQAYLPLNDVALTAHALMNSIFVIVLLTAQKSWSKAN